MTLRLDMPIAARRPVRDWMLGHQAVLAVLSLALTLAIASAWLVLPYNFEGRWLLSQTGAEMQDARRERAFSIGEFLSRWADGPGEAEVEVLYATPTFFEVTNNARHVSTYRPDRYLVFLVNETTHISDLPAELPQARLTVDGRAVAPYEVEGPIEVEHHRTITIRFDAFDASGDPLVTDATRFLELELISGWDAAHTPRRVAWELPIDYPDDLLSGDRWSALSLLAVSAGLLSFVLTPCLLQLIVIYVLTLSGLSAEQVSRQGTLTAADGRRVFLAALAFVAGFSGLFTAAGAGAGFAGKEMQLFFAEWSRSVGIVAGLLVIGLGLWVGIRARAPLVCRIPRAELVQRMDKRGFASSALMAVGFSLGCITCFGGAIIATMLIYVGTLGSPWIGATVMFTFSLGVAVPFLLAALFLSRMLPLMTQLSRYAPYLGFASMVVIIGFGTVLVTDNFHVFSGFIYPYLGLG